MFQRYIKPLKSNSFFLFGARGTGKSTFTRQHFHEKDTWFIDLLDPEQEDTFARRPKLLEDKLKAMSPMPKWVVIDEVQRVPRLLDLVHRLIESSSVKFVLTGSSARKLRRGASNLLAGRAFVYKLFPLTTAELDSNFRLEEALSWGTLPKLFSLDSEEEKATYLRAYALNYLKEEIQAEQLVRRLDPFRQFLEVAAQSNGKILNFNKIARDVDADNKTVQSYFQILEDTWLGFFLPAYHRSVRKSQKAHPKFYFFDPGVKRALERTLKSSLEPRTSAFGEAFEHWVILEIQRMNEYTNADYRMSYLQTKENAEIDLILDRPKATVILIEIKSTEKVDEIEVRKFERLSSSFKNSKRYYLSRDPNRQQIGSVLCMDWKKGLEELFSD